ncbi:hypothetical protein GCM10007937_10050 [Mesorhizobium albiziae]|nr:hypothetical protein GCM10007937_10050 [Mesorhizobium albiziae]
MGIPYAYGIETLSIYRDRDRDLRQRPRERQDRDKNREKDLRGSKAFSPKKEGFGGKEPQSRTVCALHGSLP